MDVPLVESYRGLHRTLCQDWAGSMCCVLWRDTLLPQRLSPFTHYPDKYYLAGDLLASVKIYFNMETYTIYTT